MEGRGSEVQRTAIQHLISLKITHHCTEYCILSSTSVLYLSSQLLWIRLPSDSNTDLQALPLLSPLLSPILFSSLCLDIPTERRHRGEEEDEEEAEENEGEG
jgi:hypothetical protein